jgi:antitoxin component YwqK of YwqJK toxin-antitoxin module
MKKLLTLISILFFFSCQTQNKIKYEEEINEVHENGNISVLKIYRVEEGKRQLNKIRTYYRDGSIGNEYEVNNFGQFNGYYNEYHLNGKLKISGKYINIGGEGKKDGFWYYYDRNGNLEVLSTEEFKNGVIIN